MKGSFRCRRASFYEWQENILFAAEDAARARRWHYHAEAAEGPRSMGVFRPLKNSRMTERRRCRRYGLSEYLTAGSKDILTVDLEYGVEMEVQRRCAWAEEYAVA